MLAIVVRLGKKNNAENRPRSLTRHSGNLSEREITTLDKSMQTVFPAFGIAYSSTTPLCWPVLKVSRVHNRQECRAVPWESHTMAFMACDGNQFSSNFCKSYSILLVYVRVFTCLPDPGECPPALRFCSSRSSNEENPCRRIQI